MALTLDWARERLVLVVVQATPALTSASVGVIVDREGRADTPPPEPR